MTEAARWSDGPFNKAYFEGLRKDGWKPHESLIYDATLRVTEYFLSTKLFPSKRRSSSPGDWTRSARGTVFKEKGSPSAVLTDDFLEG